MINSLPQSVGVWGLGIVGRSVINYFKKQGHDVAVMDKKEPSAADAAWLAERNVRFFLESTQKELFFAEYPTIVPSAGIDLLPYANRGLAFVSELDLFAAAFKGKIIGITGTIAKTSVTTLVAQTLRHAGVSVVMGGNIGVGLLDLLDTPVDYAVLELSSFQLDLAKSFAVDCAIITNFFPNHLDRHRTEAAYWAAKERLLTLQKPSGIVIAHAPLHDRIKRRPDIQYAFFAETVQECWGQLWFSFDSHNNIITSRDGVQAVLVPACEVPTISFPGNWLIVVVVCDLLHINCPVLTKIPFELPDHRLHCIATINGVAFFDDSKSTIPESTLAAVKRLADKPVIVLIGGLSKGVDRRPFVARLKPYVKAIVCFGKEAEQLHGFAQEAQCTAYACTTLEEAVKQAYALAQAGDQIVLSPAGSSFDLFANYHERGTVFANIVENIRK
jgi:UDP-N-acetylmuramoylalanine--D-glutamate ligase